MPSKVQNAKQPHAGVQKREVTHRLVRQPAPQSPVTDPALLQRAIASPDRARPSDILALQRTVGNQAVSHLIQAKLTVGPAHDRYEQEADRVAEQVVGGQWSVDHQQPNTTQAVQRQEEEEVQTKPLAASITPLVQRQEVPEEEELQTKSLVQRQQVPEEEELQTKSLVQRQQVPEEEEIQTKPLVQRRTDGGFEAGSEIEQRLSASRGGGSPLSAETRAYMEPRFGVDFSGVRIHADAEAVQMNRELQARAFTHGQDIYLGAGAQSPGSAAGNRLLAHELTHSIQQSGRVNRIQRWGQPPAALVKIGLVKVKGPGTMHDVLTERAFTKMDQKYAQWYSAEAKHWLCEHSDDMDKRGAFQIGGVGLGKVYGGIKEKGLSLGRDIMGIPHAVGKGLGAIGRGMSSALNKVTFGHLGTSSYSRAFSPPQPDPQEEARKKKEAADYENLAFYWRPKSELPNHGEAGGYKANGAAADEKVVDDYVANAVRQWKSRNPNQSLLTLALALHAAEDRGAHGDGAPGTGHDPRKKEPPNEYVTKTYYNPTNPDDGFDCDRATANPDGFVFGINQAISVLMRFVEGIGVMTAQGEDKSNIEQAKAGGALATWQKPGMLKGGLRGLGRYFGKDVIRFTPPPEMFT